MKKKKPPTLRIISPDGSEKLSVPMVSDLHVSVALCGCTKIVNEVSDATVLIAALSMLSMLSRTDNGKEFLDLAGLDVAKLQRLVPLVLEQPECTDPLGIYGDDEEEP